MSVQLTMVKTKDEHWVQQINFDKSFLKLEFSEEHQISITDEKTIVKIGKQSELYQAFNDNLKDVFKMGMERALEVVLKELKRSRLDKKQCLELKRNIAKEMEKESVYTKS